MPRTHGSASSVGRARHDFASILRVAVAIQDQDQDIWMWDFARRALDRVTSGPDVELFPVWTPNGGRLLFVLIEMVLRRPINQRFELMVNAIGFFLLIALILVITFNDVIHLF